MDASFERALLRIPPQLRERPGARFTVIINGQKKPEGKDWSGPNGANYSITSAPLAGYLSAGHNYGVLCGHAGIVVPDLDDAARLDELGIMARIPDTFMVRTGRDDNRAQEKYRAAFSFRNKAKLMFSANVLPRSPDDTYAFYSRWILIEFLKIFDVQKGTGDPDLDAKLQTSDELSGLLNIALGGLKRLMANGWKFSYDKTVEDVEIMYKRNANPVYAFLLDECEPGEATDYIEKSEFYGRFLDYVKTHNIRPISNTKFGELLKDQTEIPVSTFRPWVERGNRPMCWQGVRFKSQSTETVETPKHKSDIGQVQSTPSRVAPTPSSRQNRTKVLRRKKENIGKIGLKPTIDGIDCAPVLLVSDPAKKARLWDSVLSKMKKYARIDKDRHGLAVSDLSPEEREIVEAAGWQQETTDSGISILWATSKSMVAMGLRA